MGVIHRVTGVNVERKHLALKKVEYVDYVSNLASDLSSFILQSAKEFEEGKLTHTTLAKITNEQNYVSPKLNDKSIGFFGKMKVFFSIYHTSLKSSH